MRRILHVTLMSVLLLSVTMPTSGCHQQPAQPPPAKETPGSGDSQKWGKVPIDWNDPRYDWIGYYLDSCMYYAELRINWSPKFGIRVNGASPDGRTLALRTGEGLALYDIDSRSTRTIVTGLFDHVTWSSNGRYIAAARFDPPTNQEAYVIYDVARATWYHLPVPDGATSTVPYINWLAGDSLVKIGLLYPGDRHSHAYSIGIRSPHLITKLGGPYYGQYFGKVGYLVAGLGARVKLHVGPVDDTTGWHLYPLSGVEREEGFTRISPDGRWLGFRMRVDLTGTRFDTMWGKATILPALGVIDLRPGSRTRYQLYRIFVDYSNIHRNCGYANNGFAWSPDGRYIYHEWVRMRDSTTQIVRRELESGRIEEISDFLDTP